MAIKLNIISAFDDRELKRAQREMAALGKSLSRGLDMAVLGGVAALGAGLAASVKSLARIQTINTQTETVIKSMGGAAGVSAKHVEDLAGSLENLTATEAESIQQGANLLLTFGNVKNSAGAGNDIFDQSVKLMVDLGRAMGTDASSSAIQLGKALNDPTKGITALTRVGVSFSDQQKEQIKTLQKSGDIMGAQKIILSELQNQFGGSGAAYAKTFSGQVALLGHELGTMGEDIAMTVMPAMQGLVQAVRDAIPEIGPKLKAAVESVDWKALVDTLILVITNIDKIAIAITGLWAFGKVFAAMKIAIDLASVSMAILNGTIALNPFAIIAGSIAVMTAGLVALGIAAFDANNNVANLNSTYYGAGSSRGANYQAQSRANRSLASGSRYTSMEAMGAALGLNKANDPFAITPIIPKASIPTNSKSGTARAAADKASAAVAKRIADAKKLADEAKKAYDDLKKSVDEFNTSFAKTAQGFIAVFKFEKPLGQFEQQAVDAFQSMKDAADEAFGKGLIDDKALASLKAYASQESALLIDIAKQRDVLAKKISIAQAITSGVMGSLNITNLLETQTKTVTQSVTKIVDGIAVTTTKTFDEIITGNLANNFRKLVDKTKTFANNLIELKKLGLNGNLFRQIVDAGAEAGGATAEAIIAGGADTVKELNSLFTDLTTAGSTIAETATPVMYALGEDITNSFIDGLRSQDQILIDQATALAALFTSSFQTALSSAMAPTISSAAKLANLGIDNTDYIPGYGRVSSTGTNPNGQSVINLNVNAGVIANKQELPQIIVDALGTYTKQSGAGGLTRVLGL